MRFYLGTHHPDWLGWMDVPLCVSYRWMEHRAIQHRAESPWMLDSGGFTEVSKFGAAAWDWDDKYRRDRRALKYARMVEKYGWAIGQLDWAAPMDWMCEPDTLKVTKLSVAEHQRRTVENFLDLRNFSATAPIMPVIQGWEPDEYRRCVDRYVRAGVDLTSYAVVGLGSVCRRAATAPIVALVEEFSSQGIKLHGFGCKSDALGQVGHLLASADSMAWSLAGTKVPGCAPGHKTESNCSHFALAWRERVVEKIANSRPRPPAPATRPGRTAHHRPNTRPGQLSLFG